MIPPRPFGRRYPAAAHRVVRALRRWRTPRLSVFSPRSTLELPVDRRTRALVPAVDFHGHLGRWLTPDGGWMEGDVGRLLADMDAANVTGMVNLDGRWGSELEENLDRYDRAHPGRFHTFCHADWRRLDDRGGPDRLAESVRQSVAAGARGLKIWKDLGLRVEVRGRRILLDDPLLEPVWEAVAEAGIPALVHVADPVAFFLPADRHNERLEEMRRYPRGARHGGGMAEFRRLLGSLEHVVATHPRAAVIAAHCYHPEDLAHVSEMLGRYPNFSVDIAAVASQLGRQPRTARAFILRHADRVLFGTDIFPMRPAAREPYFRLLETADESFAYGDEPVPSCGRWEISGLDLPPSVLAGVYRDNAVRLLGLEPRANRGTARPEAVAR